MCEPVCSTRPVKYELPILTKSMHSFHVVLTGLAHSEGTLGTLSPYLATEKDVLLLITRLLRSPPKLHVNYCSLVILSFTHSLVLVVAVDFSSKVIASPLRSLL